MNKEKNNQSRRGNIKYKIIKKRNINEMLEFFKKEEDKCRKENEHVRLYFEIEYEDEDSSSFTFSGNDISVFDDTKMMKKAYFTLMISNRENFDDKKMIFHATNDSINYEVVSYDEDWLDSKFTQLENILKRTPNQSKFMSNINYQIPLANIAGLVMISLLTYLFGTKNTDFINKLTSIQLFVFIIPLLILIFITIVFSLKKLIFDLFLVVEFDTMKEDLNKNKKQKRIIISIVIYVLIPILINIFF